MQNTESASDLWHRPCSRCGKECFSDLLDKNGLCDYCREIEATKVTRVRENAKRRRAK